VSLHKAKGVCTAVLKFKNMGLSEVTRLPRGLPSFHATPNHPQHIPRCSDTLGVRKGKNGKGRRTGGEIHISGLKLGGNVREVPFVACWVDLSSGTGGVHLQKQSVAVGAEKSG
jgi:hypothetical protein